MYFGCNDDNEYNLSFLFNLCVCMLVCMHMCVCVMWVWYWNVSIFLWYWNILLLLWILVIMMIMNIYNLRRQNGSQTQTQYSDPKFIWTISYGQINEACYYGNVQYGYLKQKKQEPNMIFWYHTVSTLWIPW